jgi:hypothetical protein
VFRPASAATMRIFSVLKSPPRNVFRPASSATMRWFGNCSSLSTVSSGRAATTWHVRMCVGKRLYTTQPSFRAAFSTFRRRTGQCCRIAEILALKSKSSENILETMALREEFKTEFLRINFSSKRARSLEILSTNGDFRFSCS